MELNTIHAHLLVYLALVCGHLVAAQQQQQQQQSWQQAGRDQLDSTPGERVERLTSPTGDLIWRPSLEQLEWMLQTEYKKPPAALANGYYVQAPQQADLVGIDGPTSSYHALVDEFKQFSRLANPSRENRAFKPKLMSTARGFGKRAHPNNQQASLLDLVAPSNGGAIFSDAKGSGETSR